MIRNKATSSCFFGGLEIEEIAAVLEVSPRTVKRDWQKARAFLYHALH